MTRSALPSTARPARTLAPGGVAHAPPGASGAISREAAVLARYLASDGRRREVLRERGRAGSLLVVDRDSSTLGDHRLVAHLPPDEPVENAALVCRHYLHDPPRRRCRALIAEDTTIVPFAEEALEAGAVGLGARELRDRHGASYRLEAMPGETRVPQLRWCRHPAAGECGLPVTVSVRDAVGSLESYGPVRLATLAALLRRRDAGTLSLARLRAELERLNASRIVLNRGLREAVLHFVRVQGLSMSEIALRCGRVKYDARGNASGETSWLARRVGIAPEGGQGSTTPWVHSEVLAVIARRGLGVSPCEVEVD